jgi:hypothetical protein
MGTPWPLCTAIGKMVGSDSANSHGCAKVAFLLALAGCYVFSNTSL